MKGFASRTKGPDHVFVWMYRKSGANVEANIRNVSVEKYFYGKPGETSVDDQITRIENEEYSPLLDQLRTHAGGPVFDPRIPTLISHLSLRTRSLRQSFADSTSRRALAITGR